MVIALVPVLVMVVGLLLWALSSNPKAAEAGRIAFFVGLFFTVQQAASSTLRLG